MKNSTLRIIVLTSACFILNSAQAQHLPNSQKESVYVPVKLKIDGDYSDWNNGFKAYNTATSVFYSIANNSDNLFIIIKALPSVVRTKILAIGATITFKNPSVKNSSLSLTYPLISTPDRSKILKMESDPLVKGTPLLNQELHAVAKEIKISGFNGVKDSVISVYNENGIQAAVGLDTAKALTIEISIPLRYLKAFMKNDKELSYNVRINAFPFAGPMGNASDPRVQELQEELFRQSPSLRERVTDTDFSELYIIVNK